jgi:hypothetical protein
MWYNIYIMPHLPRPFKHLSEPSAISVEPAKHMPAKFAGIGVALATEVMSESASGGFADKLRTLGTYPFDYFNHTGNMGVGMVGAFFGSYVAMGAQVMVSKLRGTTETASVERMNRVSRFCGLLGAAAASYTLEKLGGQVDVADVVYGLGAGACTSALVVAERKDPEPPMDGPDGPPPPEPTPPTPPYNRGGSPGAGETEGAQIIMFPGCDPVAGDKPERWAA